jgi:HPt (histidine-containing phosphotransfer) domain-containing protein
VDWEIFEELAGNDASRLQELSERYLRQTAEQFAKLHDAIATGAAPDVKRIAHSAAGSSAMCGMNPMVALLRELERMGQLGQLADAPRAYARIKDELARIAQFFRDHIEAAASLKGQ